MSFFKPTLVIANRLSFFAKLSCVVIIFLVPFLWLVGNSINQQRTVIHIAEDMNQGVATLMDIKPLALELAKHRGIMAQYLGGADTLGDSLNASEAVIDRYLAELSAGMAQIPGAALLLEEIRRQWRELKIEDFRGNAAQSFTAHTLLVAKTHNLMVRMLDFYKVILQHQSEQYYLTQLVAFTLPQLQETLGQLRGRGAGALTDGLLSATERAGISGLNYGVHNALDEAKQWVLLLRQSASLSGKLEQSSQNMFTQYRDFETLVSQQLLDVGVPSVNNTDFFAAASAVINAIGEFDQVASQHFLVLVERDLAQARAHLLFTAALSVFCVLLGCYLATGILMALNASVNAVNRSAEAMTRGDFTQAINVQSRDVVGDVARNLAGMASQVSGLIGAIQHSANQVNRLSVDLQAVTDVTQAELDRQNNQTQQSASAAIEMAATVREVARNCADTSLATEVARDIAFEGRTRVMQAMNSINHLGEDVAQANTIIGQLQEDAAAIGAVLEVIGSIADQTNLLALNAAIEAARAGEQGRGFAVVADEVRSLAKRTQDSTAEIRTVIETLQGRALSAVNIIQASFDGARESVASAASAGEALDQIVNHVETLRDLNTQIASAAEQQAAVAEQMSGSSQELGIASDNIMAQVGRTLDYSVTLRQSASELLENTLRFKTL